MALPAQPLPCPERPTAAAARPSRHLHPPSRRPPRRASPICTRSVGSSSEQEIPMRITEVTQIRKLIANIRWKSPAEAIAL
uniref:Uncharacterized protein n=1 Tax=Oryza meridionalis TaxID=40149 RepID=A0A0E0CHX3_9ORYZ